MAKKKKIIDASNPQKTITFTDVSVPAQPKSKKEYHDFMSKKPSFLYTPPSVEAKFLEPKEAKPTPPNPEEEQKDRELQELLTTTKLVSQYAKSTLKGRDRINHMTEQIELLAEKKRKRDKTSLPIYLGMKEHALKRVKKQIQETKDLGNYTKVREREIISSERILEPKKKIERKKEKDLGDRVVNGILRVKKSTIKNVGKAGNSGKKKR